MPSGLQVPDETVVHGSSPSTARGSSIALSSHLRTTCTHAGRRCTRRSTAGWLCHRRQTRLLSGPRYSQRPRSVQDASPPIVCPAQQRMVALVTARRAMDIGRGREQAARRGRARPGSASDLRVLSKSASLNVSHVPEASCRPPRCELVLPRLVGATVAELLAARSAGPPQRAGCKGLVGRVVLDEELLPVALAWSGGSAGTVAHDPGAVAALLQRNPAAFPAPMHPRRSA